MELTRLQISDAALALEGIPFLHQGRDRDIGLDCAGVLVATFRRCGVTLREEPPNYRRLPDEDYIRRCLALNFAPVAFVDGIRAQLFNLGDVVHIKFARDREARHLGIVVPGPRELMLIHALRAAGRVILEPLRGLGAAASIVGVYEWPRLQ